ncbi:hypothetical protein EJ03DRAFT_332009 [Teratosphaeria nubilosa]|uniref:Tr-type G domain-containing protein n=1 Tax=Teratosphaeria nubilosa TaxID=161662 RepID=A0A6G1KUE2_9PEZI|nr:hypothetical protein EJ03DRAFT_332009 [Teratosphaeria nubilosa]
MQRNKNIDYDEDDTYDGEDDYAEDEKTYSAEDRDNFATLTPVVRAELEEAGVTVSDQDIEDALWHYYWDVAKSVTYLKNARTPKPQPPATKKDQSKKANKFDQAAQRSAEKAGNFKGARTSNDLAQKTEALQLDRSAPAPAPKIRSKGMDVLKIWQEQTRKPHAAFVVIGHVDHGKSTLMGRLLSDAGAVSQRDIDRYQKQASEMGKASFALAWVMDSGTDERERGVTIDIAQHPFSTDAVDFTILDAPGHKDFVPAMIGGASMADIAVLVVDANQLESGMKGQTREHIQLAKAAGLQHTVVAVNKLDSTTPKAWSEQVFDDVKLQITKLLNETGFADEDIRFVPCSGLNGDNVAKPPPNSGPTAWVSKSYPTLVKALEASIPKDPRVDTLAKQPFRLQVTDVFRGGVQNPLSISGRISTGTVQTGETLSIQPSGETVTVKGIEVHGEAREWAIAGEIATLHLANDDIEANHLRSGDMACSTSAPVAVAKNFEAVVEALDSLLPQAVDVHIGRLNVAGQVKQLVGLVDGGGEITKRRPRLVKAGQRARILLEMEEGIPLAEGSVVVLRAGGSTVACGGIVVKG